MNQKKIMLNNMEDAKKLVVLANRCDFDIDIYYNRVIIDAKSILGVLSLDFTRELTVDYAGHDEALEAFLDSHASIGVVA